MGPASAQSSYLNVPAIITAATLTNADGIHPGYGFLSENQRFAEIIEEHNIKFIGPHSSHIKVMGNKIDAKKIMDDNQVPTVPGLNEINDKVKMAITETSFLLPGRTLYPKLSPLQMCNTRVLLTLSSLPSAQLSSPL